MSQVREIDGQTGELIGNYANTNYNVSSSNYGYSSSQQQPTNTYTAVTTSQQPATYTTTTTNYVPGSTSYVQQGGYSTSAVNSGYAVGGGISQQHEAQVVNTVVNTGKEVIKGESRIEYVPFEKKVVEYKDEARVERVPKKRTVTEYREEKVVEEVPREVTVTDYYAVEYLRQYIPQYVPEKQIEYVARERKVKKYEYIPVERYLSYYLGKLSIIPNNPYKLKLQQMLDITRLQATSPHNPTLLVEKPNKPPTWAMFQPNQPMSKAHTSQLEVKMSPTPQDQSQPAITYHPVQELDILEEVKQLPIQQQTKMLVEQLMWLEIQESEIQEKTWHTQPQQQTQDMWVTQRQETKATHQEPKDTQQQITLEVKQWPTQQILMKPIDRQYYHDLRLIQ